MSITLAIYDSDIDFANHFMDYIKRKYRFITQVLVFTNEASLESYIEHNSLQVLIAGEEVPEAMVESEKIKNICFLSEEKNSMTSHSGLNMYKYQSAEHIMTEIVSRFQLKSSIQEFINEGKNNVRIITVFALGNETVQMLYSLFLAKQIANTKKTLHINLDVLQTLPQFMEQSNQNGLSELIYYLKQNNSNLSEKINTFIIKDKNYHYMQGASFGPDLYELSPEDMVHWINELKSIGQYEIIIFNVSSFFITTLELFRRSSQLLVLTGTSMWERKKYDNFIKQLKLAGYEDIIPNIKMISFNKIEWDKYLNLTEEDLEKEIGDEWIKDSINI